MKAELEKISQAVARQEINFDRLKAVARKISFCQGKVILTGVGKSGIIAKKIAATLTSIGVSALFIHPTEALHGDIGLVDDHDIVICLSYSGSTPEVAQFINRLKNNYIICISNNPRSAIAYYADKTIPLHVNGEADPLNIIPTISTTTMLVIGDLIAIEIMKIRGVSEKDLQKFHPGGSIAENVNGKIDTKFICIIPARYDSKRFTGKVLKKINGVSMIQRVYQQAIQSKNIESVYVATDSWRIHDHVKEFGQVIFTGKADNGTERCIQALKKLDLGWSEKDVLINLQADMPFILPEQIDQVCEAMKTPDRNIATLVYSDPDSMNNPNKVKAIVSTRNYAMYFGRSPIPSGADPFIHVGIYAFRMRVLPELERLRMTELETSESLEQLRWLENGYNIYVEKTPSPVMTVDCVEDLFEIENL